MQRRFLALAALALGAATLTAAQAQTTKLTLGHGAAPGNPRHEAAVKFADTIKAKTGGRYEVQVAHSSQLGDDAAMVTALRSGTLDMSANSQGAVANVVPEYAALGLPFLFNDIQSAWKLLDGPIGEELAKRTAAKGMVVLGYWDNGIRHVTNSKRPIKAPADLKGLKVRTPPDAMTMDIMQTLGADAQQIKFSELYVALQQGVVDGQENPLANIVSAKLYEVQKYLSLTGHLRLGKLTLLWDDNRITDDGSTDLSISEDVAERFRVAQWHVVEVDGHDIEAVSAALDAARRDPRPSLLACRTVIAKGIERLQGQRGGHSARLHPEDAEATRRVLGWRHPPFEVPAPVRDAWRAAGRRSDAAHAAWRDRLVALPAAERAEFERVTAGELPAGWREVLREHRRRAIAGPAAPQGGILISAEISDLLTDVLPERMVGCADLEAPTGHKRRLDAFTAEHRDGAYVHCGVREHLMGAMANGMAAHGGVIPLAVTYLAFADYERPAMRMAALMRLPVHFVFSHDSIGVGKNGPTHQPVEVLASLRAMPNMRVFRPADAVEASECWEAALEDRRGPSSLVFARQALPPVRHRPCSDNLSRRGAYVLEEAEGGARAVTLLATGSEVLLAVRARERLQAEGIPTAVVSMPCWALFDEQHAAYRAQVLAGDGGEGGVRGAVEAAVAFGWERWLGERGAFVGMTGFGASGPAEALYAHFGITADAVADAARRLLRTAVVA